MESTAGWCYSCPGNGGGPVQPVLPSLCPLGSQSSCWGLSRGAGPPGTRAARAWARVTSLPGCAWWWAGPGASGKSSPQDGRFTSAGLPGSVGSSRPPHRRGDCTQLGRSRVGGGSCSQGCGLPTRTHLRALRTTGQALAPASRRTPGASVQTPRILGCASRQVGS